MENATDIKRFPLTRNKSGCSPLDEAILRGSDVLVEVMDNSISASASNDTVSALGDKASASDDTVSPQGDTVSASDDPIAWGLSWNLLDMGCSLEYRIAKYIKLCGTPELRDS